MPEQLQLRTEHSRSVEDAEKYRALATLKEVGLLIPLTDIDTFHGRVGNVAEQTEWSVDPAFANGGNDSGNHNLNHRAGLYTGEEDMAREFAEARIGDKVRGPYWQIFRKKVDEYTPAERKEWLDRLNQRQQDWWNSMPDESRQYYPNGPRVFTAEHLDDPHEQRIEADELAERTVGDERRAIWNDLSKDYRAEVHEIASADTDATVINASFNENKLDESARASYYAALSQIAPPITEGSPLSFEHRDAFRPFAAVMNRLQKNVVPANDVALIAAEAGIDERVALQLVGAYNARQIGTMNLAYLADELMKQSADLGTINIKVDDERQDLPINFEYAQRLLRTAHIVGLKQDISSDTLGRDIVSVTLFDLEKVATSKDLDAERQATWKKLGAIASTLGQLQSYEVRQRPELLELLDDVHAKPENLVAAAKHVEGYKDIFDADAGNWEGYTLAEHTETVLRNFDENYADTVPVELLAPMRLAILGHDVGKPLAAARGEKHKQDEYNVVQARDFYEKLGIDNRLADLLVAAIGEGEELVFQAEIKRGGESAESALKALAKETMQRFNGNGSASDEQIDGFIGICRMLQLCDGGAYTSMAITNRGKGKGRYRNAPSFNSTFVAPVGFGKRSIRLRNDDEPAAPHDLSPATSTRPASRIRISKQSAGTKSPSL